MHEDQFPPTHWRNNMSIYERVLSKSKNRAIGLMSRVFTYGLGDRCSIPGRVIPKTQKMVLDTALLNTQHFKVRIKSKVEQSREWNSTLPLHFSVVAIEKGAFKSPLTKVANFTYSLKEVELECSYLPSFA